MPTMKPVAAIPLPTDKITAEQLSVTLEALRQYAHRCRLEQHGQQDRAIIADSMSRVLAQASIDAAKARPPRILATAELYNR